nr:MAG TPA: hypothetical protein [Caudoviricetes sp.]
MFSKTVPKSESGNNVRPQDRTHFWVHGFCGLEE